MWACFCIHVQFKVLAKSLVLPTIYEFRATFVQLRLRIAKNESVMLNDSQTAIIRESNLKAVTEPLQSNASGIVFTLLRTPKVSDLILRYCNLRINFTLRILTGPL